MRGEGVTEWKVRPESGPVLTCFAALSLSPHASPSLTELSSGECVVVPSLFDVAVPVGLAVVVVSSAGPSSHVSAWTCALGPVLSTYVLGMSLVAGSSVILSALGVSMSPVSGSVITSPAGPVGVVVYEVSVRCPVDGLGTVCVAGGVHVVGTAA